MSAVDTVLSRLDSPRPNGPDRWRCACPVCGGNNRSTLSVGQGDTGAVLLKCWKSGCAPESIAHALGLDLGDLFPERQAPGGGTPPMKRRRLLTASQALELLGGEITLAIVCAADLSQGIALDEATRGRLQQGAARVALMHDEVRA